MRTLKIKIPIAQPFNDADQIKYYRRSRLRLTRAISIFAALVENSTTRRQHFTLCIEQTVVGVSVRFGVVRRVPRPSFNVIGGNQPSDAARAEVLALIHCLACKSLANLLCARRRGGVARARGLLDPKGHVVNVVSPVNFVLLANQLIQLLNCLSVEFASAHSVVVFPVRLSAFVVVH